MTGLDAGGEITSVTTPKTWEPGITHMDPYLMVIVHQQ
jgi:hypothetical protein